MSQLEKAREAVDAANLRAAYAEIVTQYLSDGKEDSTGKTVEATQKQDGWTDTTISASLQKVFGSAVEAKTTGSWTVTVDADGKVSVK